MNKKEVQAILNKESCPLCEGQLDGSIHPDVSRLYCVVNNDHYKCWYKGVILTYAKINLEFTKATYQIESNIENEQNLRYSIMLYSINTDLHPIHREKQKKKILQFSSAERFGFKPPVFSEEKFLYKMKLYNLFS